MKKTILISLGIMALMVFTGCSKASTDEIIINDDLSDIENITISTQTFRINQTTGKKEVYNPETKKFEVTLN